MLINYFAKELFSEEYRAELRHVPELVSFYVDQMIFSFKYYICNNSKLAVFPEKWLLFSLQLLFQLIIDYLTDFSFTPAVFEMITEQLKKTYFNILIKPETLAKWVLGEGKRGCAAVVKVEQRAQKSLLCAGGGLFWGGSWPWELRQLCSQCIKLEAQTRPAGSCSSEAAGAEAGQGEPTAVLLLSQKWDRLH